MESAIDAWICNACVGRPALRERVLEYGHLHVCTYCNAKDAPCCPITYLHQFIWPVFYSHYGEIHGYAAHPDPPLGEPISVVFQKLALVGKEAAEGIRQAFSALSLESGEDWPSPAAYLETAQYLERGRDSEWQQLARIWSDIKDEALTRTRYFNTKIEAVLRGLLVDINSVTTADGTGLIRTFEAGTRLHRARVALSREELTTILTNPVMELGPPPNSKATAGRVNASGIALFYGSLEAETCLAEVRPPVGSQVVTCSFALRRPVRLLDLTLSDEIELAADFFAEDYEEARLRWAFLRSLGTRLAEPIMPGSESTDYIPTQLVCEFISQFVEPKLDGIVYPSSQSSSVGKNVAMFFDSSIVQPWDRSLTFDVSGSMNEDDETVDLYTVRPRGQDVIRRSGLMVGSRLPGTLSLLKSTIVVAKVEAVTYRVRTADTDYSEVRKPTTLRFGLRRRAAK